MFLFSFNTIAILACLLGCARMATGTSPLTKADFPEWTQEQGAGYMHTWWTLLHAYAVLSDLAIFSSVTLTGIVFKNWPVAPDDPEQRQRFDYYMAKFKALVIRGPDQVLNF